MRPYGIPRHLEVEFPDVADIQRYGMKSCVGKLKGDQHSYTRSAESRRQTRRFFKKSERMSSKQFIRTEI
jgi:hypothetical protein